MKKMLTISLLCVTYSSQLHAEIIFNSSQYRLESINRNNIISLRLTDRVKSRSQEIRNCISNGNSHFMRYPEPFSYDTQHITFYESAFKSNLSNNEEYLRFEFDDIGYVFFSNTSKEKHVLPKCGVIDLATGTVIATAISNDELCNKETYRLEDIIPNIGLPVKVSTLINYIQNNEINSSKKNLVDDYLNLLLCTQKKFTVNDVDLLGDLLKRKGFKDFDKKFKRYVQHKQIPIIPDKIWLYNSMLGKTNMYLIKGDKVTLLDEQTDDKGQKWYFINYKGKKDLNMWIKAEAVDMGVEDTK